MKIIQGDSLEVLKRATPNSVDSIVTDPPYGISFMGKKWDYDVPSVEVLKYSNCCGAEIINEDIEVCPQCKEPCEFIDGEEEDI